MDYFKYSHLNKQSTANHHHHHQADDYHYYYDDYDGENHKDDLTVMQPNVSIILCNINPIRLSALFSLFNGSDIYSYLITKYGKIDMTNLLNDTFLTQDKIKHMTHSLSSTLKSCQYGDDQCSIDDFNSIFTTHGWCYQFELNISKSTELKLILDPEEYDYLIPNNGYVGFYLNVQHKNCTIEHDLNKNGGNNHNNYAQSIIVGPKFHSYISIQQQYFIRRGNYFDTDINKDICPTYHIQSVVQLEKLPIQIHLLQKFNVNLFKRNGTIVQHGILYQQKAFLQIFNHTAYHLIKNLSKELYHARNLAKSATEHIWTMYKQLKYLNENFKSLKTLQTTSNNDYQCSTLIYNLFQSVGKDILSKHILSIILDTDEDDVGVDEESKEGENGTIRYLRQNETLNQIELLLINSFFETKVIVSPSSSLLRKILTMAMKFRYLLSNNHNQTTLLSHHKNISSAINNVHLKTTHLPLTFTNQMNCSKLITYYEEQINQCSETVSLALTSLNYINLELHNAIKSNQLTRLIFPKSSTPYNELSASSMVSLSIRMSKMNMPTLHQSSTSLHMDSYLKNLLLTIFISIFTLYLTIFILIEFCTMKQTMILTNQICSQSCQLIDTNQHHPPRCRNHHHHQQQQHQDEPYHLQSLHRYNQLRSFETSSPNNNNKNPYYYQTYTQNYYDNHAKNGTYFTSDQCNLNEAASIHNDNNNNNNLSNTLNSFISRKQEHCVHEPTALLHTSNIMYQCDNNICQTKAHLHDTIEDLDEISVATQIPNSLLPKIGTLNDPNLSETILLTPKSMPTPYSCCSSSPTSSKYHFHSPYIRWNITNRIQ
ncbi:unnamed protein product [Schistosoma turkestanicum]|nr:unnamed protein product [Schistosoma turkestanicum]